MTYQAPAFMVGHPVAGLPLSDISTFNASTFTDDSKRALIDSRQGVLGSFTALGTFSGIQLDFGIQADAPTVNRCVVPKGHTFSGYTLNLISDEVIGFASQTVQDSIVISDASILDYSFTLVSNQSAWMLQVADSVADDVFSFSEFWLGLRKTLTSGDGRVDPGFESAYEHDLRQEEYGGRTATLELAPARRRFSLTVIRLDPANADYATLDEVIRLGRSNPFWYWPPDTEDPGPYLVRLTRAARRTNDTAIPTTSIKYRVDLEMLEELT